MSLLSIYFVLVIFVVSLNCGLLDNVAKTAKGAADKFADTAHKLNEGIVSTLVNQLCDKTIELSVLVGKGLGTVKCDDAHKTEKYCKVVDNFELVMTMVCATAEDQRKGLTTALLGCIKVKDGSDKGQSCMKKFYDKLMEIPECAKMASEAAGK